MSLPRRLVTLLCRRDLELGLLCLGRMREALPEAWPLDILDDGTLGPAEAERLLAAFPDSRLWSRAEIAERVEPALARHPHALRYFRSSHLGLKLLAPPLLFPAGFHYTDSDILFLRPVTAWWPEGDQALALDEPRVHLAQTLRQWLQGLRAPLARQLNAGLLRQPPGVLDLDQLEHYLRPELPVRWPHVREQTATALLFARVPHQRFDQSSVRCDWRAPRAEEIDSCCAIHLIAWQKSLAPELARRPWRERPPGHARFLPGSAGGLPYQITTELRRRIHEVRFRKPAAPEPCL